MQFADVDPSAENWSSLDLEDSKKYIALGVQPKSGDPWTNPTSQIFWAVNSTPVKEGSLAAGATAALQLTAKNGHVFDQAYTSAHQLVLEFSFV